MKAGQGVRLLGIVALLAMAACQREAPAPQPGAAATDGTAAEQPAAPAPVALDDVSERTPRYLIGITYPKSAAKYPGLAAALKEYADAARAEVMQALEGMADEPPTAPYDLSLSFTELHEGPRLVAVAADGSSYTGGAHGNPLIARFVWLPQQQRMLTSQALVPDANAWVAISDYAREQLHTRLSERVGGEETTPAERAELMRNAGKMIDEGTEPSAANFAQFEPIMSADGRIQALRFVFPPYQVGPYSDGVQEVEVPASVLLPKVAPDYRDLFVAG